MDPFIGEIRLVAFNYPPVDWAFCGGQSLNVQQNPALYTVIGNTYGGDNVTFKLPNLQGSLMIGSGQGTNPDLPDPLNAGETVGASSVTLTPTNMPSHDHTVNGNLSSAVADLLSTPNNTAMLNAVFNGTGTVLPVQKVFTTNPPNVSMAPQSIGFWGSTMDQPHDNRQPYLAVNFIICTNGDFPISDD